MKAAVATPPLVVTVMLAGPRAALAAMLKVAPICIALTTTTLLTILGLLTATVAPERKFVPVRVTGTLAPVTRGRGRRAGILPW